LAHPVIIIIIIIIINTFVERRTRSYRGDEIRMNLFELCDESDVVKLETSSYPLVVSF